MAEADGVAAVAVVLTTLGLERAAGHDVAAGASSLTATLADVWPPAAQVACEAHEPVAGGGWKPVAVQRQGGYLTTAGALPFTAGCVMLRCQAA